MSEQQDSSLQGQLFDNLRSLITLIDQLRDLGVQEYIKLPRIAVLGSQSAGKSSLLENIVGLDFLPRGEGIVTRRPLEMRLIHKPDALKPWAVFDVCKDQKFFDFEKVREYIVELTDKATGNSKDVVPDPIVMTVYSRDCPDLTVIDLPGITRIAIKGQREDIEKVTLEMATHYCQDERTIILAVCPANQDLSTSDGLQLAIKLDPTGSRTLGVITKIDIMDQGTDCRKELLGQIIPLKLGFVGVKNRNQKDINEKVRVGIALQRETDFFAKHPLYSQMPPDIMGTKALIQKLTTILFKHIRASLPQIIREIDQKVQDCEVKLAQLGPGLPRDNKEKMQVIWNMLTEYTENLNNKLRGKFDVKSALQKDTQISGGAQVKLYLNELYNEQSGKNYRVSREYTDREIREAIRLHQAFYIQSCHNQRRLRDPAIDTLNEVFTYVDSLSNSILKKVFYRFPTILDAISDISSQVLTEQKNKTKVVVENLIDAELGYIFTNDQDYLTMNASIIPQEDKEDQKTAAAAPTGDNAAGTANTANTSANTANKPAAQANKQDTDPEKVLAQELSRRLDAYYRIVIRNLRDSVPKAIGYFLVRAAQEQMQFQLYNEIMKSQSVMGLMSEPEYITIEKRYHQKDIVSVEKCIETLEIRSTINIPTTNQ
ncbi:unnamed protein product (macronuclear) [Paramecium tetraurelia]|uniref:Dynamin-related protein n=1 Tax=Paramecium tetraurelia TaxID=5888 RepID=A0BXE1_PARTE|nr:uncharacterized protein GSPATT00033061001 [Paramecium tetraurelia]CAK63208.1 unnamed protein product [Paramecium tetraurelia]|eukprot:XP_001430606.1 hypothetical protein (macronuclear) [Paramecium tetraurelia strain d4-2]